MSHPNARLTARARLTLVERVQRGASPALVAAQMGVSRATVYKWLRRFDDEGLPGLADRSSRPRRSPRRTDWRLEQRVVALRRLQRLGPQRIAERLGLARSTTHRVLTRHRLHRLSALDRATGQTIRRYERERPGELVHLDVKKLARIPDGGGWRLLGRAEGRKHRAAAGYEYVHSAVDDRSRLAYSEIHGNETGATCAAFLVRAIRFFAAHGVRIERVMTDNARAYTDSFAFQCVLDEQGIGQRLIRPYRPQTNGKVERFNRTLLEEWAYSQLFASNTARREALSDWLNSYNHERIHHAIGAAPISRVNNVPGRYT